MYNFLSFPWIGKHLSGAPFFLRKYKKRLKSFLKNQKKPVWIYHHTFRSLCAINPNLTFAYTWMYTTKSNGDQIAYILLCISQVSSVIWVDPILIQVCSVTSYCNDLRLLNHWCKYYVLEHNSNNLIYLWSRRIIYIWRKISWAGDKSYIKFILAKLTFLGVIFSLQGIKFMEQIISESEINKFWNVELKNGNSPYKNKINIK